MLARKSAIGAMFVLIGLLAAACGSAPAGSGGVATPTPTPTPTPVPSVALPSLPAGSGGPGVSLCTGSDLCAFLPQTVLGEAVTYLLVQPEMLQDPESGLNFDTEFLEVLGKTPEDLEMVFGGSANLGFVAALRVNGASAQDVMNALITTTADDAESTPAPVNVGGKNVLFVPLVPGQDSSAGGVYLYAVGDVTVFGFVTAEGAEDFFRQLP
jgi:hypothetical protein